jgi:hypothetical protein
MHAATQSLHAMRAACNPTRSNKEPDVIHELRIYRPVPGRLPNLLDRFRSHTLRIWERLGIRQAGFWTTTIGESEGELTYLLAWESMAEREAKWGAFQADPEWIRLRAESERDGPINANISSQFLTPTDFSAVK